MRIILTVLLAATLLIWNGSPLADSTIVPAISSSEPSAGPSVSPSTTGALASAAPDRGPATGSSTPESSPPESSPPVTVTPAATNLRPAEGPRAGGTEVTISGTDLDQVTDVMFGAKPGEIIRATPSSLTVVTPRVPTVGPVKVVLLASDGTEVQAPLFTYQRPSPQVSGLSPRTGEAGTRVTIGGTGLGRVVEVTFGDRSATILDRSATAVVVRAPEQPGDGPVLVTVAGPDGTDQAPYRFRYAGQPESTPAKQPNNDDRVIVDSTSPASGPSSGGTEVTITGTNLDLVTGVRFGNEPGRIASQTPTRIVAVTPAVGGIFSVNIIVEHPKGGIEAGRFAFEG